MYDHSIRRKVNRFMNNYVKKYKDVIAIIGIISTVYAALRLV